MNFIDLLLKLSPALEKGKALSNADTWSNVVNAKLAIVTILGFALAIAKTFGYEVPVSDDQIVQLGGALASVGGTFVLYFRFATNTNRGIERK